MCRNMFSYNYVASRGYRYGSPKFFRGDRVLRVDDPDVSSGLCYLCSRVWCIFMKGALNDHQCACLLSPRYTSPLKIIHIVKLKVDIFDPRVLYRRLEAS